MAWGYPVYNIFMVEFIGHVQEHSDDQHMCWSLLHATANVIHPLEQSNNTFQE